MASENDIIHAIRNSGNAEVKIRIIDQLGHKIKPQHRELIRYLVDLSRTELNQEVAYSIKRALFQIRTKYNITNFPLFLMDPLMLIQSSDPAYRIKALEIFESKEVNAEQSYYFVGSIYFEDDPFVLSKMLKVLPRLEGHLSRTRLEMILNDFIQSEDSRVRANAVEALSLIQGQGDQRQFDILWACLRDRDQRVRTNSIRQLLDHNFEGLESRTVETLKKSNDYYELLSTRDLARQAKFEILDSVLSYANKKIEKAKADVEEEPTKLPAHPGVGLEIDGAQTTVNWSMMSSMNKFYFATLLVLVGVGTYFLKPNPDNGGILKENKELKTQLANLQSQTEESEKLIASLKEKKDVLLAKSNLSLEDKIGQFKKDGKLLKSNANIFFETANLQFKEEKYTEAVSLYKALYDVYKDNRLAVDSVRWLSKTQKVQNVLASVADYQRKNQFISAHKKLEEMKHLVSNEVFQGHFNKIEEARKKHQGIQ